jgi:hypothetical protein
MNNLENNQVYHQLQQKLLEMNLNWVVNQVAEQVLLGKPAEKEIETLKESSSRSGQQLFDFSPEVYRSRLQKGPRATFPVTEEYKANEKLMLLIDAIEQVVICTAEMEADALSFFQREGKGLKEVFFADDAPDAKVVKLRVLDRTKQVKELNILLNLLRSNL